MILRKKIAGKKIARRMIAGRKTGRRITLFSSIVFIASALGMASVPARASGVSDDVVLRALSEEMARSKTKLKMDNVAAPYYIEYRVTDLDSFEASAVFGALRSQRRGRGRFLRVVVRIGDYKQDSYYGTGEGTADLVPVDDDVYAIRRRVWLATDRAYKAAGEALSAKQAALKELKVDQPVDDFAPAPPVELIEPVVQLSTSDVTPWVKLIEDASALYRADPALEKFESSLRFVAENRYFVSSEGTVARTGHAYYSLSVEGSTQAPDGMPLARSYGQAGQELGELPSREKFLDATRKFIVTLQQMRNAPLVDEEYRGPVLFSSNAARHVVADLIAPNVLGKKPKLGENARTVGKWSSSYKSRVLPDFINVFDDPTISAIAGKRLFGNYSIDDEGVKAQRVSLVEKGQLVSYLVGREPIRDFPASNGHGRGAATAATLPQAGNLILVSADPQPEADLKKQLIEMCRQRDLKYGLYVESMGSNLEPRLIYRVWVEDGREEPLRGAVFGDLDVRALRSDLIAAGDTPGVEDRFEPVWHSVVSPALLFDELQVKRSEAKKQELPEYPAPPLSATAAMP